MRAPTPTTHPGITLLTVALLTATFGGCATREEPPPAWGRATIRPASIRAVWVDSWGEGLYTREQCDAMIEWSLRNGFNTLLVEVSKIGDAYFDTNLLPRGRDEGTGREIAATFDPLGYIVSRAKHRLGFRVEAWIVANRVWKDRAEPGDAWPNHVVRQHPEWLLRNRAGEIRSATDPSVYLDPSNPLVRAHVAAIAADIVRRYDVDAIHLDYIRYPDADWGYGATSLRRYRAQTGSAADDPEPNDPDFIRWRARQVTDQVRAVRRTLQEKSPEVDLTAAVVSWGDLGRDGFRGGAGYRRTSQDWVAWSEAGLLDTVYVMHYRREHVDAQARSYRDWLGEFDRHRGPGRARVVIGQGSYLNNIPNSVRQLGDAVARGFDGVAVFSYRTTNQGKVDRETFGSRVRDGVFGIPEPLSTTKRSPAP